VSQCPHFPVLSLHSCSKDWSNIKSRNFLIHFKPVARAINLFIHLFRDWWLGTSLQTKIDASVTSE